jgi:hypothetical protein
MTRTRSLSLALVLIVLGVWLLGCGNDDSASRIAGAQPLLVTVFPEDGATDVPTTDPIFLTFNTPMDAMSVMEYFHCSGGDEMWSWMDSLQHHGPGPGGHMRDMDHMMEWMSEFEHPGEFHWNEEMTECVFRPDGGFAPDTDYMVYLEGDVRAHSGQMMDMHHLQYDGLMIHFRTGP